MIPTLVDKELVSVSRFYRLLRKDQLTLSARYFFRQRTQGV
jgi:predicted RNA binding protein with dsRBD fold (UPF0201 family)